MCMYECPLFFWLVLQQIRAADLAQYLSFGNTPARAGPRTSLGASNIERKGGRGGSQSGYVGQTGNVQDLVRFYEGRS